jgi:hypothetical protein
VAAACKQGCAAAVALALRNSSNECTICVCGVDMCCDGIWRVLW